LCKGLQQLLQAMDTHNANKIGHQKN